MARDADIKLLASALAEGGGLKLWSVIVTILGDMAQGGQVEVSGPVLSAIIEEMGLQPQAMRVALHRLKRDGWVEARHAARIGYYGLSAKGMRETKAVSARVYGPAVEKHVRLAVVPVGAEMPPGAVNLARQTALVDADAVPPTAVSGDLCLPLPPWAIDHVRKSACETQFAELCVLLNQIGSKGAATLMQDLTVRILILHSWRRLVLRSNPVAETVLGSDCAANQCRTTVTAWLAKLPLPDADVVSSMHA